MSAKRSECAARALELERELKAAYAARIVEAREALEAARRAVADARTPEEIRNARHGLITARAILRALTDA